MIRWFRRRRPSPPPAPKVSPEDRLIAAWWGFTPQQWQALPQEVRAEKREQCVYAPGNLANNYAHE